MSHGVDLSEIQRVVSQYTSQSSLPVAAGPMAAATAAKVFMGKSKLVNLAMVGGGVWFAVQELATPLNHLIRDQFGYLQSVFSAFGN